MSDKLLEVKGLKTYFSHGREHIKAVDGVDFHVNKRETLGIVGESGCGKSVTSLSIMRLVPEPGGRIVDGQVLLDGMDLIGLSENEMCKIRGNSISMIFQEPMTSLNPVFKCGDQIAEAVLTHMGVSRKEAADRAIEMLRIVGIPEPEKRAEEFPHQLSGGMRQRVMIAMALSCDPKLLIADEPTTALDVTIQAQILELLNKLQAEIGMSIIMITHDLGVIAKMADRVAVMYAGKIVEEAEVFDLFEKPLHPYTEGLLKAIPNIEEEREQLNVIRGTVPSPLDMPKGCRFSPRCDYAQTRCFEEEPELVDLGGGRRVACFLCTGDETRIVKDRIDVPQKPAKTKNVYADSTVLEVKNLKKYFAVERGFFRVKQGDVKAVDDVSLTIRGGEAFGLVGESGCGKTTLGKTIVRLYDSDSGSIVFDGKDLGSLRGKELTAVTRNVQMIFQDPYASLNPRMTVEEMIMEPLIIHKMVSRSELHQRAVELIETVGLSKYHLSRYPHEFSGGQRQRIGVARALSLMPKLIICDEPVSALDESVQSQVLNLLKDLQREFGLSYLFISHDLAAVKHVADRIGIMYLGKIVETLSSREILTNPLHPYTQALISAIPAPNPKHRDARQRIILEGEVPSPINPPSGCRFHTRCRYAKEICSKEEPCLEGIESGHEVACHLSLEEMKDNI